MGGAKDTWGTDSVLNKLLILRECMALLASGSDPTGYSGHEMYSYKHVLRSKQFIVGICTWSMKYAA